MALARKIAYLASATRFQWKGLNEIRAVQTKKLRAILTHDHVESHIKTVDESALSSRAKLRKVVSEVGKSAIA